MLLQEDGNIGLLAMPPSRLKIAVCFLSEESAKKGGGDEWHLNQTLDYVLCAVFTSDSVRLAVAKERVSVSAFVSMTTISRSRSCSSLLLRGRKGSVTTENLNSLELSTPLFF